MFLFFDNNLNFLIPCSSSLSLIDNVFHSLLKITPLSPPISPLFASHPTDTNRQKQKILPAHPSNLPVPPSTSQYLPAPPSASQHLPTPPNTSATSKPYQKTSYLSKCNKDFNIIFN